MWRGRTLSVNKGAYILFSNISVLSVLYDELDAEWMLVLVLI